MLQLKKYRVAAGLTQQDIAIRFNVDRSTVSYWERGAAMPSAAILPDLATLLHCTIDALFGCDESTQRKEEMSL